MSSAAQPSRHVHVEHVMGTVVSFDVRDVPVDFARDAVATACRELHRIDGTYSTYRPDSAIRRIDRGELDPAAAADDVQWVLARCAELHDFTHGWFDARATGQLDPSALVKGWAAQRASDLLVHCGVHDHCVNAGGDVACRGGALPSDHWRVGIQHPHEPTSVAAVVEVRGGGAVATSGLYERGAHIVDPIHGRAPGDAVLSVTVVGSDLALADAYATAAFAMGAEGPAWTATLPGYEALTILAGGQVLSTERFPFADADAAALAGSPTTTANLPHAPGSTA